MDIDPVFRKIFLPVKPLRILVVEDNDMDFLIVKRQLNKLLNIEIIVCAPNRKELFHNLLFPFDLIVTDFHLPDVEGQALIGAITGAQPDTPCLIMSGSISSLHLSEMPPSVFAVLEKGNLKKLAEIFNSLEAKPSTSE